MSSSERHHCHLRTAICGLWLTVCGLSVVVAQSSGAGTVGTSSGVVVPLPAEPSDRPIAPLLANESPPARFMRSAGEALGGGDLAAAVALQQQAVEGLSVWIEQSRATHPAEGPMPTTAGAVAESLTARQPGAASGPNGDGAARNDTAGSRTKAPMALQPAKRRTELATSVWGHLPDREREAMRQSLDAAFLPGYEELIEDYYEALAEQGLASDRPAPADPEPVP